MVCIRKAEPLERACFAIRRLRCAVECSELHDGRVEQARVVPVEQLVGKCVEMPFPHGSVEGDVAVVKACEHSIDIAVEGGVGEIESKRGDGSCGVFSDSGHGEQCVEYLLRRGCAVANHSADGTCCGGDELRSTVQVAGTRVVAEPLPVAQHLVFGGLRQCLHIRKTVHEAQVVLHALCYACLLEDDFGNPDAVRVGGFAPRQDTVVGFVPSVQLVI